MGKQVVNTMWYMTVDHVCHAAQTTFSSRLFADESPALAFFSPRLSIQIYITQGGSEGGGRDQGQDGEREGGGCHTLGKEGRKGRLNCVGGSL